MPKVTADSESQINTGGKYLDGGIHGPVYITFAYENLSPNGTSNAEGLAMHIEDTNGAKRRVMITLPTDEYPGSYKTAEGRIGLFARVFAPNKIIGGEDWSWEDTFKDAAHKLEGSEQTPVWIKLRYGNNDFPTIGYYPFLEHYVEGQETTLKFGKNEASEPRQVPEASNSSEDGDDTEDEEVL